MHTVSSECLLDLLTRQHKLLPPGRATSTHAPSSPPQLASAPAAMLCRAVLLVGPSTTSASSPTADMSRELASSSSVLSACRGRLRLVASAGREGAALVCVEVCELQLPGAAAWEAVNELRFLLC